MDRKFGRKRDILLVASLLAAAGILWLVLGLIPSGADARAEIYVDGTLVETVPLSGPDRAAGKSRSGFHLLRLSG